MLMGWAPTPSTPRWCKANGRWGHPAPSLSPRLGTEWGSHLPTPSLNPAFRPARSPVPAGRGLRRGRLLRAAARRAGVPAAASAGPELPRPPRGSRLQHQPGLPLPGRAGLPGHRARARVSNGDPRAREGEWGTPGSCFGLRGGGWKRGRDLSATNVPHVLSAGRRLSTGRRRASGGAGSPELAELYLFPVNSVCGAGRAPINPAERRAEPGCHQRPSPWQRGGRSPSNSCCGSSPHPRSRAGPSSVPGSVPSPGTR